MRRHPQHVDPRTLRQQERRPLSARIGGFLFGLVAALAVLFALAFGFYRLVVAPAQEASRELAARPEVSRSGGLSGLAVRLLLSTKEEELRPVSGDSDAAPISFEVHPGETATDVAVRLQNVGLIRDASAFGLLLREYGIDRRIEAGRFQLTPAMSSQDIALALLEAQGSDTVLVTLEGWRLEQVAEAVGQAFGSGEEWQRLAATEAASHAPQWAGLPAGVISLEGMLFPDTYRLDPSASTEEVLGSMLANFELRFDAERRSRAAEVGMTPYEVLTLASVVEREAVVANERPLIAGVFLNRLRLGMPLQADPTVQYALGRQEDTGRWWKVPLWAANLTDTDSPYNTYLYPGLIPGPICSPGLSAIDAVLWPEESDYLYFVARGDGSHAFSVTFEEHVNNVSRYQGG